MSVNKLQPLWGDVRSIARAISLVEAGGPEAEELLAGLYPRTGRAYLLGITGPPGGGKSTLTDGLIAHYRSQGLRVGVLAVDPSSPFSGGAILGDRVRMQKHATDPGVFIRSMGSRGHLGGLALATADAAKILDAAGYDIVLLETVGIGQSEVEVSGQADTTVLVTVPGLGDDVQALKAGVMEIADIFAVNKADRDGVERAVAEIEQLLAVRDMDESSWLPPIVQTVARDGTGISDLAAAIERHRSYLTERRLLESRRRERARRQVRAIITGRLDGWAESKLTGDIEAREDLEALYQRKKDPYSVAGAVLKDLGIDSTR
jgi:LAO/AO transport system kinase